jgi:hypothetical protein
MATPPGFYNPVDQAIYSAGDFFIPQQRFRAAPYSVNNPAPDDPAAAGIPAIYQSQGGGGGGFNPYNPDMSQIRTDFRPEYDFRQASEINAKTFNPQPFTDPNQLRVRNAQIMYNKAAADLADPFNRLAETETFTGMRPSKEVMDFYGEKILDNQERYRTQGQFVDPYDPLYSSETEARKQMDMYPDYYYGPPKTGLEQLASKAINFIPGIGTVSRIAGFLSNKLPINERAILENQLRGQGVLTDNIGRIVAQPGQYNTPEGIMAGYNAAKMTDATFDKRTGKISETLGNKYGISQSDIQGLIDGTITDEDIENKYGVTTNLTSNIRNIELAKQNFVKTKNKAAAIAKFKEEQRKAEAAAKKAEKERAAQYGKTNYGEGAGGQSYSGSALGDKDQGFGIAAGGMGGPVSNRTGRGRTDYMDGGLADMLEIYD